MHGARVVTWQWWVGQGLGRGLEEDAYAMRTMLHKTSREFIVRAQRSIPPHPALTHLSGCAKFRMLNSDKEIKEVRKVQ